MDMTKPLATSGHGNTYAVDGSGKRVYSACQRCRTGLPTVQVRLATMLLDGKGQRARGAGGTHTRARSLCEPCAAHVYDALRSQFDAEVDGP